RSCRITSKRTGVRASTYPQKSCRRRCSGERRFSVGVISCESQFFGREQSSTLCKSRTPPFAAMFPPCCALVCCLILERLRPSSTSSPAAIKEFGNLAPLIENTHTQRLH